MDVVPASMLRVLTLLVAVFLAPRNLRLKRSDRKGAARLAVFVIVSWLLGWLLMSRHSLSAVEFRLFVDGLAVALFWGALVWLYYIALEPFARRLWPESLTTWTRILNGRVTDPTVGRDILVGAAAAPLTILLFVHLPRVLPVWFGMAPPVPHSDYWILDSLADGKYWLGVVGVNLIYAVRQGFMFFLMPLLLFRVMLRSQWLACAAFVAINVLFALTLEHPIAMFCIALQQALILFLLMRFGVLAVISAMYVNSCLDLPISMDSYSWYFESGSLALGIAFSIALFGFFTSLGGRRLFHDLLPEGN